MRNLAMFGLLLFLTLTFFGCGEPEPEGLDLPLHDDFEDAMSLDWIVLNGDSETVSLESNPGFLSISPQPGRLIRGDDKSESGPPTNLHLIELSEADQNMLVVLTLDHFAPTMKHENCSILFYDDADNYVLGTLRFVEGEGVRLQFMRETDGEANISSEEPCLNPHKRLKLKIRKEGNVYRFFCMDARKQDDQVGPKMEWGDGTPQYVGFFASTAHLEPEGVEDLMIDTFDLRAIEPPAED
jgi:hypothetical protein